MVEIASLILPFFGLIAIGFIAAKLFNQSQDALGWLNVFIIYFALPALFFKLLSTTPIEQFTKFDYLLTTTYGTFAIFVIIFLIGIFLKKCGIGEATIMGFGGAYGNIGYMGPGIALLAFGEAAAVPVALIFSVENAMHFTLAPLLMALTGQEKVHPIKLILKAMRSVLLHPFILATIVGITAAIFELQLPLAANRFIDTLSAAAAPCALFAMGLSLAMRPLKRVSPDVGYIICAKLVIHPLLILLLLSLVGNFDPIWVKVAVLLASLPTAANVFVLAQQYGFWIERASATILISTVLSVLTTSAFLGLLETGVLPTDLFP